MKEKVVSKTEQGTSFMLSDEVKSALKELKYLTGRNKKDFVEEGVLLLLEMQRSGRDPDSIAREVALQRGKSSIESLISEKLPERTRRALVALLADPKAETFRELLLGNIGTVCEIYEQKAIRGKIDS